MSHNFLTYKIADTIKRTAKIEPELFSQYGVKRGLRNENGSGVLVGLTRIGNVVGYEEAEDGSIFPVPGRLLYRGYDVNTIVDSVVSEHRFGYEEVAYLLLSGSLPDAEELEQFRLLLVENMPLPHEAVMSILTLRGTNVMNILARSVLELYNYDESPDDMSRENMMAQSISLIAHFPTIIAYAYNGLIHHTKGLPLHIRLPNPELSYAENFLYMLKNEYSELEARTLDQLLILQAEHGGGNNSTFTVRVTSSTQTDMYSSIAAAIGSLKGPLHGGANLKLSSMFDHLKGVITDWQDKNEIRSYLKRMLDKEVFDQTGLIYGIGHAVYTITDPRAEILRPIARELAAEKDRVRELEFMELVEREAIELVSSHKSGNKATSNVDFWTGFLYDMIQVPQEIITPIFAMARCVGWAAHRNEELTFSGRRIIRPAYRDVGETSASYIPLQER
ncbi:MAG: citrate synthase [Propionibacteriaceae bacterium]|nr:citrate synthase [Propionibacteriaceae bacterium]